VARGIISLASICQTWCGSEARGGGGRFRPRAGDRPASASHRFTVLRPGGASGAGGGASWARMRPAPQPGCSRRRARARSRAARIGAERARPQPR